MRFVFVCGGIFEPQSYFHIFKKNSNTRFYEPKRLLHRLDIRLYARTRLKKKMISCCGNVEEGGSVKKIWFYFQFDQKEMTIGLFFLMVIGVNNKLKETATPCQFCFHISMAIAKTLCGFSLFSIKPIFFTWRFLYSIAQYLWNNS